MIMHALVRNMRAATGIVVAIVALQRGPTSTLAADNKGTVRPVSWRLSSIDGQRAISLRASVGYCVGDSRPRVDHIKVVERSKSVFITVYVRFPVPAETSGACAGVRLILTKRIQLKQTIGGRTIYDGSSAPPRQRWP
jgi:hypothetical protein